jgi:hypothetical protein
MPPSPKGDNTRLILILAAIFLVLCCCCALAVGGYLIIQYREQIFGGAQVLNVLPLV